MYDKIKKALSRYTPENEQEENDRKIMLDLMQKEDDLLTRDNKTAHFTASAWIVNRERTKVLMAYHNIYQAWAWTGGHADGEEDLLLLALREANEETGIHAHPVTEEIYSLEILTVDGHEKRGAYVSSHLHLNVTYLLEADEAEMVRVRIGENTAVRWFTLSDALTNCSEKWMVERVYRKLNEKLERF